MEVTLDLDVLSKTSTEEIVAEKITEELDDILDEVVNMAKTVGDQKPVVDNIEEAAGETDFAMQTGETLELEIALPIDITESQAKTTPLAEETKSAFDALIDAENEVMDSLAKEAVANDAQDASSTVTGKDSGHEDAEQILAEDSNTREEDVSDALSTHNEKSSEDNLVIQESESEVKHVSSPVGEASIPQGSTDHLADVFSKKIEMTVSRLIEKELSVLVERIVTEKIKGILANIR